MYKKDGCRDNLRKKMLGRYAALFLTAAAAVMASGCGKKEAPAVTSQAAETAVAGETEAETQESGAAQETVRELQSEEEVGIMCGTVKDASMNAVIVANDAYPDGIAFSKEDAAVNLAEGLLLDREVTVFYKGKLEADSSAEMKAELVRDPREGDEERQAGAVSGEVLGIGMSVITIRTKDGTELSLEQDPKPVNLTEGPVEGDKVTIYYSHEKGGTVYVPELIQEQ